MKRQSSAEIGGYFFQIEDDAYRMLEAYLSDIRDGLDADVDKDELMKDVEQRVGELLEGMLKKEESVGVPHIERVMGIMGTPEDFSGEDSGEKKENSGSKIHSQKGKKLYRNPYDRIIGGVASGMADYFGIGVTPMRIIWLIAVLISGVGVLLYIIFWIILPKADSRLSYMRMKGEPLNIENIKKRVKEEYKDIKKTDMSKVSQFLSDAFEEVENFISGIFSSINAK